MRSRSANFIIRVKSMVLHALLQQIAQRAYDMGVRDAQLGRVDPSRVRIDPHQMRKFE